MLKSRLLLSGTTVPEPYIIQYSTSTSEDLATAEIRRTRLKIVRDENSNRSESTPRKVQVCVIHAMRAVARKLVS